MAWDASRPKGTDLIKDSDDYIRANFQAIEEVIGSIADPSKFKVTPDGDVGIGVSSPDVRLEVNSGEADRVAIFESSDVQAKVDIKDATGDWQLKVVGNNLTFRDEAQNTDRMTIDPAGKVGIATTDPAYTLDVSGDIHCTGKLTSDGGNDPAYVLYDYQTRKSIIELVKKEVPPNKLSGAVLFFNGEKQALELFIPLRGEFRSLSGELLEKTDPVTETSEVEKRYYFDEETGEIESYEVKKSPRRYKLKAGVSLDPETGKFKKAVKRNVKKVINGEEKIVEVIEEVEVTKEEAIEEAKEVETKNYSYVDEMQV